VGPTELAPTASLASASDFFSFANGDVGWIIGDGSAVSLARLHHCD
jgi:hypothetical protein